MKRSWMKAMCDLLTLSALVAGLQACAADSSDAESEAPGSEGGPVATIPLENGNSLDFYDMGSAALVSEGGQAYRSPIYKPAGESESLSAIWTRYAKGLAVPARLLALQERLESAEALQPATGAPAATVEVQGSLTFGDGGNNFDKTHCGNGCCDKAWLQSDFAICSPGVGRVFQFDKISPWMDVQKVWYMDSFVCAATATAYEIKIDGRRQIFNLATGRYQHFNVIRPQRNQNPFAKPYFYYHVEAIARTVNPGTTTHCFAHSKF